MPPGQGRSLGPGHRPHHERRQRQDLPGEHPAGHRAAGGGQPRHPGNGGGGEGQPQPTFTLGTVTERKGVLTCCGGRSSSCWSFLPRKAEINKGSLVL